MSQKMAGTNQIFGPKHSVLRSDSLLKLEVESKPHYRPRTRESRQKRRVVPRPDRFPSIFGESDVPSSSSIGDFFFKQTFPSVLEIS